MFVSFNSMSVKASVLHQFTSKNRICILVSVSVNVVYLYCKNNGFDAHSVPGKESLNMFKIEDVNA